MVLTQLEELDRYKNQLMQDLLTNREIVALLSEDPETRGDPKRLVGKQVFPFEYVPDTNHDAVTYLCCDVDIQKSLNKTFLSPVLYIWVFSHKKLLWLDSGGVRTDRLCSEIAKTINGSRMYGMGELDLYSIKRFAPINDYLGKAMTFYAKEINRFSPGGRAVPDNRVRP